MLSFDVLRVRGDMGKLLTFAKLYAILNLKRLEKVTDDIYTLAPEVAVEALTLSLHPIAGMLAKIDDRVKVLLTALKEMEDSCKKGSEITKAVREKIVAKTGKSERIIRDFFGQLAASSYVSDDGKKPKTYTLLYDGEDIERKMTGILDKAESSNYLMDEMQKEAQEWVKKGLEIVSRTDGHPHEAIDESPVEQRLNPNSNLPVIKDIIGVSRSFDGNVEIDSVSDGVILEKPSFSPYPTLRLIIIRHTPIRNCCATSCLFVQRSVYATGF